MEPVPLLSAALLPSTPASPAALGSAPLRWSDLITQWRVDPLTLTLLLAAATGYAWYRVRGRRLGIIWKPRRDVAFIVGVATAAWLSCGVAQARGDQLEWVWMAQLLALLLIVPFVVLAGQPILLAQQVAGERAILGRITRSRPVRILSHPLVGPALVPVIFLVLIFGGLGQAAAAVTPVGWLLHSALILLGAMIALPLIDAADARTSLAVALALAVGFVELIMDIFPGVALRLSSQPVIGYFATHTPAWAGGWMYQQHQAGGLLWITSELLDLPFLVFLAIRWVRVDAAEAARVDAQLDTEAAQAKAGAPSAGATGPESATAVPGVDAPSAVGAGSTGQAQRPWFLDDPQLRDRYRF